MGEDHIYVKDLRVLKGVDLSEVIIIDNSVLSFIFQMDNGIPILPFYENKNDIELKFLINYLENLAQYKDIRYENKKLIPLEQFKNKVSNEDDICNSSKYYQLIKFTIFYFILGTSHINNSFKVEDSSYSTFKKDSVRSSFYDDENNSNFSMSIDKSARSEFQELFMNTMNELHKNLKGDKFQSLFLK